MCTTSSGAVKEEIRNLQRRIWQLVKSSNTNSQNVEHDAIGFVPNIQELGWSDGQRPVRCWVEKEEEEFVKFSCQPGTMV